MKKNSIVLCLSLLLCVSAAAQKISKPTLTPVEPTAAQVKLIEEGIALHQEKRYDDAIAVYQLVLKENPDSVLALYEISLSFYAKKDFQKALDYLDKGIKYNSDMLSSFYRLIGSIADDMGNPKAALKVYEDALKITPNDPIIRYDLGVTQYRLGNLKEAKESLKKSVELQFNYPSPHALLSSLFYKNGYRIPAVMSAMRLTSMEINSPRSEIANKIILEVLKVKVTKGEDGKKTINIFMNPNAPTDEGDFTTTDLMLSLSGAAGDVDDKKESKKLTDEEKFVDAVENFVTIVLEDKKNKSTFVGKNYFPFLTEMKKRGYVEPFAYLVLQQTGNAVAEKWLIDHSDIAVNLINWSRSYK